MGGRGWLGEGNRRNIFWAAIGVLLAPMALALLGALWFAIVLMGAHLGLWHLEMDR